MAKVKRTRKGARYNEALAASATLKDASAKGSKNYPLSPVTHTAAHIEEARGTMAAFGHPGEANALATAAHAEQGRRGSVPSREAYLPALERQGEHNLDVTHGKPVERPGGKVSMKRVAADKKGPKMVENVAGLSGLPTLHPTENPFYGSASGAANISHYPSVPDRGARRGLIPLMRHFFGK